MPMEPSQLKKILEALLFVTDQPLTPNILKSVLGENAQGCDIEALIKEIGEEYERAGSPMELRFIAEGWQFATRKDFSPWIRKLFKEKTILRLSVSALETLSIIAYKQPITRSEIEEIRGVEVTGVLETLLERKLIHIVGRKETLGRPLLYGTTSEFLRHFGLSHLSELPSLDEMALQEDEVTTEEEPQEDAAQEAPAQDPAPETGTTPETPES